MPVDQIVSAIATEVRRGGLLTYAAGALITDAEATLYSKLASRYTGEGAILDGGAFIGGSTIALCEGLPLMGPELRLKPVIAIDRFIAKDEYIRRSLRDLGHEVAAEDSFLDIFLNRVRRHLHAIEVRAGNVKTVGRVSRPIELCVVDVAKSPAVNDFIVTEWLPRITASSGVLVQQDFFSPFHPWIALSMAPLLGCFRILPHRIGESAVFTCRRTPTSQEIEEAIAPALSPEQIAGRLRLYTEHIQPRDYKYLRLIECLDAGVRDGWRGKLREAYEELRATPAEEDDFKWSTLLRRIQSRIDRVSGH